MNQNLQPLKLSNYLTGLEGWGRAAGAVAQGRLRQHIEAHGCGPLVRISLSSVKRIDVTFAREALINLVRHYQCSAAICLINAGDPDVFDNVAAAAAQAGVPLTVWQGDTVQIVGRSPSRGNAAALELALARPELRAADLAGATGVSVANASTKLKQLCDEGFIMRRQSTAPSGGIEFVYARIG